MNIKKMRVDDLNMAKYNPRKDLQPGDKEYEKIKRSINAFGYVDPVIVNEKNNVIVGGHQRIKVLKDLGYENIDCSIVNLSESEEKQLNIALNKIDGDWDAEKLEDLLRELTLDDTIDVELTGFSEEEINKLMSGLLEDIDDTDDNNEQYNVELPENLDDYYRDLNDKEQAKKSEVHIKIGNKIKIIIDNDTLDSITAQYKEVGEQGIVNRLLGVM